MVGSPFGRWGHGLLQVSQLRLHVPRSPPNILPTQLSTVAPPPAVATAGVGCWTLRALPFLPAPQPGETRRHRTRFLPTPYFWFRGVRSLRNGSPEGGSLETIFSQACWRLLGRPSPPEKSCCGDNDTVPAFHRGQVVWRERGSSEPGGPRRPSLPLPRSCHPSSGVLWEILAFLPHGVFCRGL